MSAGFYATHYWRNQGRLLWNARRLLNLLLAVTEIDENLPGPRVTPIHADPVGPWVGLLASWETTRGDTLQIRLVDDRLHVAAPTGHEVTGFRYRFSHGESAGLEEGYAPLTWASLNHVIQACQTWLTAQHGFLPAAATQLANIMGYGQDGIKTSASSEATAAQTLARMFALAQLTHIRGGAAPFLTFMGMHDEDDDLSTLQHVTMEWLGTGNKLSSIMLYTDGSLLWDADGDTDIPRFGQDYDAEEPAAGAPHTLPELLQLAAKQRAWICRHDLERVTKDRLGGEFLLPIPPAT